jgi:hypothetical protein
MAGLLLTFFKNNIIPYREYKLDRFYQFDTRPSLVVVFAVNLETNFTNEVQLQESFLSAVTKLLEWYPTNLVFVVPHRNT